MNLNLIKWISRQYVIWIELLSIFMGYLPAVAWTHSRNMVSSDLHSTLTVSFIHSQITHSCCKVLFSIKMFAHWQSEAAFTPQSAFAPQFSHAVMEVDGSRLDLDSTSSSPSLLRRMSVSVPPPFSCALSSRLVMQLLNLTEKKREDAEKGSPVLYVGGRGKRDRTRKAGIA